MMYVRLWWKNTKRRMIWKASAMDVLKYLAVDFDIKEEDFQKTSANDLTREIVQGSTGYIQSQNGNYC